MTIQTALLVGMAQKLGVAELPPPSKEEHEETVEESEMIAAIADKIFDEKKLTKEEKKFKKKFESEIEEELKILKEDKEDEEKNPNKDEKKETEKEVNEITETAPKEKKDVNKKPSREDTVLYLFADGIPKISYSLIKLYAEKRGTKPNGSIHVLFTQMVNDNKLGKYKNYYGPVNWFDGKKMKKEYYEKTKT